MAAQQCTRHPDRETYRVCGRCERPFCPDCLVTTPVGGRCKECARGPVIARMRIPAWRWPLIGLTALFGGLLAEWTLGYIPVFGLIVAFIAGHVIAEGTLAVSGRRTGRALLVVTLVFLVIGVFLAGPAEGAMDALRDPEECGPAGSEFLSGVRATALSVWTWVSAALMSVGAARRLL